MYVACPACKSLYAIQPAHLRAAGGELHCGTCGARFNATAAVFEDARQALDYAEHQQGMAREIDHLVDHALSQVLPDQDANDGDLVAEPADTLPAATAATDAAESHAAVDYFESFYISDEAPPEVESPATDNVALVADLDDYYAPDTQSGEPLAVTAEADEVAFSAPAADRAPDVNLYSIQSDRDCYAQPSASEFGVLQTSLISADEYQPASYLLDEPDSPDAGISWGAIAASLLLIVLLGVQFVWQQRYRLAESSSLRPIMENFCAVLQCDLPLRRDLALVDMIDREVRDHPVVEDALLINATFVNRGTFTQAYPVFQISFSNVSGTLVAIRRFSPEEYLLNKRPAAMGMRAGEQAHVTLEVLDPGTQAVSFQFEFF